MVMKSKADVAEEFDVTLTWNSTITEYLIVRETEGLAKGTLRNVKAILQRFAAYCKQNECNSPALVSKSLFRQYIRVLAVDYTNVYVNTQISKIRGYYGYLLDEEYMLESDDPTARSKFLPRQEKVLVVYNDQEVIELIEAAGNQKNKYHAERDKLILMILADCGLRVNELVNLLDENVSSESIFVHKAKNYNQRMLYVTPEVSRQLLKYRRIRDSYFEHKGIPTENTLFLNFRGERLRNDGVQKLLKRIGKKVNLRPTVRNSPHTFRHWFAQSQLRNGVSIYTLSRLLGHSSINTTQGYLKGLADEQLINSAIKTSPLMNLKK